jgi:hypothetical protein
MFTVDGGRGKGLEKMATLGAAKIYVLRLLFIRVAK